MSGNGTALSLAQRLQTTYAQEDIELLKRTIARGANDDELALFIKQCERTGLDPFARQIYSVRRKQWNNQSRSYEEAQVIQVSIDGFRLIADRTNKYAGQVGPWWCGPDGAWREVWLEDNPPAAAKVGVMRHDFHQPIYAIALFKSHVQTNSQGEPISRWKTDPAGMIAKCAEALALRRAFPNDLSGLYTTEEMNQADSGKDEVTGEWTEHGNGSLPSPTPAPMIEAGAPEIEPAKNEREAQAQEIPDTIMTMTLEEAQAIESGNNGATYGSLDTSKLSYRRNNMAGLLKNPNLDTQTAKEYRRKVQAIDLILADRKAQAEQRANEINKQLGFDVPPADRYADLKAKAQKDPATAFWMLASRAGWTKERAAEVLKRNGGDPAAAFTDLLRQVDTPTP